MTEVSANGIKISYLEEGSGYPLVLLHGLSDDLNLWALIMPELAKHYRTIALDLRGHGQSDKPDMPYTIPLFTKDVNAFLDKLGIARANFMGLSMGSVIIQQLAIDHPEKVNSMVLLSTFDHVDPQCNEKMVMLRDCIDKGGLDAFFDEAVKLVVTPAFIDENREGIQLLKKQAVKVNSAAAIKHAINACMNIDIKGKNGKITIPTMIISGREDVFTPPYLAEGVHKAIKGSKWVVMEGVGHNLLVPENLEPLTATVLGFLQSI